MNGDDRSPVRRNEMNSTTESERNASAPEVPPAEDEAHARKEGQAREEGRRQKRCPAKLKPCQHSRHHTLGRLPFSRATSVLIAPAQSLLCNPRTSPSRRLQSGVAPLLSPPDCSPPPSRSGAPVSCRVRPASALSGSISIRLVCSTRRP